MKQLYRCSFLLLLTICATSCQLQDKSEQIELDSDGDGLSDKEELGLFHSNPKLKDSDFDLIDDFTEVKILGTKADTLDSDSDGVKDSIYSTTSRDLALIINSRDPLSRYIGKRYQSLRKLPDSHLIYVEFNPQLTRLSKEQFETLFDRVQKQTPPEVEYYALAWANTYQVECQGITTAFTFGFNEANGSCKQTCAETAQNPYAADKIYRPFKQLGIRPTMMIAAKDREQAEALMQRGLTADFSRPTHRHQAILLSTSDPKRNIRKVYAQSLAQHFGRSIQVKLEEGESVKNQSDIMFYFTGSKTVDHLDSVQFLPGAAADHLTSFAGQLTNSQQMSALSWLEHGATGSYGTVVEPCNHLQKFPNPVVLMQHYLAGATLIEAYWKSVLMPGQGVFIGDPLSKPYAQTLN